MAKKILFATGEGIGNVVQTIPVIRTLNEVLGFEIDLWHAFGSFYIPKIIPYVRKWVVGGEINKVNFSKYKGVVSTFWSRNHIKKISLKLMNNPTPLSTERSEVDCYMDIARDLGAEKFLWTGVCEYKPSNKYYDFAIHNGYNPSGSANWQIKSYPHYNVVANLLQVSGHSVCSLGKPSEYIPATHNETGHDLLTTLGILKNCKMFIGNDSGLYHCANALEVPNIVIFTATSVEKNYDARFHRFSTILGRDDLECRPCQAKRGWKTCTDWKCQQIDPCKIYNEIMEKLK